MASTRLSVSALALILVHTACDTPSIEGPSPEARETAGTAEGAAGLSSSAAILPVFQTRPREKDGRITGASPLEVQFNLCRSRSTEAGDELKFTYDFDGDGTVDELGHCRARHTFIAPATARVCVSDRRPDGAVCRTYQVEPSGEEGGLPAPDHVVRLTRNSCGGEVGRYMYVDALVTPPLPAGQGYSLVVTVDGQASPAYQHTIATFSNFDCNQHSPYLPDSSALPNEHVAAMPNPACALSQGYLFTSIEGGPPAASRLEATVHDFQVPGRRIRIVGRTTFTCP